ncbi:MAG: DUF166 domain-containing protein [Promethearchaeota archaeon]
MMIVGLLTDGKYGDRALENLRRHFRVELVLVPEIDPSVFLDDDLDLSLPDCDVYLSYVRHPDVILQIVEACNPKPVVLGVTPGLGLLKQAQRVNSNVVGPRTMCSLEPNSGIPAVDELAEVVGRPAFELLVDGGFPPKVVKASVVRASPCGSSVAGARLLEGKSLTEKTLQEFALAVCHECRAPRFGHTCDKEVSGIIHVLQLVAAVPEEAKGRLDAETRRFLEDLEREAEARGA